MDSTQKACAKCHKTQSHPPLKRCAKCQNQWYCSRDCQKGDWKAHKASCSSSQQSSAQKNPQSTTDFVDPMPKTTADFFKLIHPDTDLHQLSEKDAFSQLIDCYRMRVEDDYNFAGDTRGLYNDENPLPDFRDFLDLAETRKAVLPRWWSAAKRRECEKAAVDRARWSCLYGAVEKQDVIEHYGDRLTPMKLRLLAEEVYGRKIEGT